MSYLMVALTLLSLRMPDAETFRAIDWQPVFTESADVELRASTVALLTHSSLRFDPLGQTHRAVSRTVAKMKAAGFPVIYLQDRYNPSNPPWMYLYSDWNPTAFVSSDIGHVDLNLTQAKHVICLGGFWGQCERATVADVIRMWRADGPSHDLHLTQIVDGTFTVGQHLRWEDSFTQSVRDFLKSELKTRHADAVLSVDQILKRVPDTGQWSVLLQRQLPAVPHDVNVVMDVFGQITTLRAVDRDSQTLVFAYRRSGDFLKCVTPEVDFKQADPLGQKLIVYTAPLVRKQPGSSQAKDEIKNATPSDNAAPASGKVVTPGEVTISN